MKASTAIGIGLAFAALLLSSMMDGTSPMSFINIPALIIVLGGTGGVTLASVGMRADNPAFTGRSPAASVGLSEQWSPSVLVLPEASPGQHH